MVRPVLCGVCLAVALRAFAQPTVEPIKVAPPRNRFETVAPLPGLPAVTLDTLGNGWGIAQRMARENGLQGRVLWVDGTANLGRVNDDDKVKRVVERAKTAGFNTIVFDVKPIVGYTLYPSAFAPKLTQWRNERMPAEYDPLAAMARECRAAGLSLIASFNVFSDGHRIAQLGTPGPAGVGLDRPDLQTVLYETEVTLKASFFTDPRFRAMDEPNVGPSDDGTRIAVYNSVAALPRRAMDGHIAAIVDARGKIQVQTTLDAVRSLTVGIPTGGALLLGMGDGAEFLRLYAKPRDTITYEHKPLFVPIGQRLSQQIPLMMNPHKKEVQDKILQIVNEALAKYDLDGVIFDDRLRFGGLNADFSEDARRAFEGFVGQPVQWPDDVFVYDVRPDYSRGILPGRFYDAWLTFKAATVRNFMARARATVDRARPGAKLGVYVGSWYGEYPNFGSNYASPLFDAGFAFINDSYRRTGYADLLDYLVTGCYYADATIADSLRYGVAPGATVEAAGQLSNRIARDAAWTYAGIAISSFKGDTDAFQRCLQAAVGSTQGVMVFDLSHEIEPLWPIFEKAFAEPKVAPHARPDVLAKVRAERADRDRRGEREPPVVIYPGIPGTGQ